MKLYGLYSKKEKCLMEISFSCNASDADFCNDSTASLGKYYSSSDILWATPVKEVADKAVETKGETPWYNTDFNRPSWDLKRYGILEVVCLNDFEGDKNVQNNT